MCYCAFQEHSIRTTCTDVFRSFQKSIAFWGACLLSIVTIRHSLTFIERNYIPNAEQQSSFQRCKVYSPLWIEWIFSIKIEARESRTCSTVNQFALIDWNVHSWLKIHSTIGGRHPFFVFFIPHDAIFIITSGMLDKIDFPSLYPQLPSFRSIERENSREASLIQKNDFRGVSRAFGLAPSRKSIDPQADRRGRTRSGRSRGLICLSFFPSCN